MLLFFKYVWKIENMLFLKYVWKIENMLLFLKYVWKIENMLFLKYVWKIENMLFFKICLEDWEYVVVFKICLENWEYVVVLLQGKYKQAKEAYEQFINSDESNEDTYKATAHKQLGTYNINSLLISSLYIDYLPTSIQLFHPSFSVFKPIVFLLLFQLSVHHIINL